jgi:hypothetical protein
MHMYMSLECNDKSMVMTVNMPHVMYYAPNFALREAGDLGCPRPVRPTRSSSRRVRTATSFNAAAFARQRNVSATSLRSCRACACIAVDSASSNPGSHAERSHQGWWRLPGFQAEAHGRPRFSAATWLSRERDRRAHSFAALGAITGQRVERQGLAWVVISTSVALRNPRFNRPCDITFLQGAELLANRLSSPYEVGNVSLLGQNVTLLRHPPRTIASWIDRSAGRIDNAAIEVSGGERLERLMPVNT